MNETGEKHSTTRFSNRVEHYVRTRPSYPAEALDWLADCFGSFAGKTVADIGSGTGILSALLLDRGATVVGIEPNDPMRQAGDRQLQGRSLFRSTAGTAEATGLADQSIDAITAAQAFPWFDPPRARQEFARILKPAGFVALLWNTRRKEGAPFDTAFEAFVQAFSIDYRKVNHSETAGETAVRNFFAPATCEYAAFPNRQVFDFAGLLSRALSSSFLPDEQHPRFPAMREALRAIFDRHQQDGRISYEYRMEMYSGRLNG